VSVQWAGAAELEGQLRPVEDLVLLPGNPRQGDVGAITQSLERFGQLKPIVVDSDGVILAGNHTYRAALELGWTHVAAVDGGLEGAERPAFALADNRLSDLASYDNEALLAMIETAGDLSGTGYDSEDADYVRRMAALETEPLELDPGPAAQPVDLPPLTCPNCGHEFDLLG
jgi:hypothetical protein